VILAVMTMAFSLLRKSHVRGDASVGVASDMRLIVKGVCYMLNWALTFLVVAIVAAILGFGGIAGTAAWIAKVFFIVFLVLFVISLLAGRPWRP
jgi:uncharacterized membrane protein YtjA (UPF0391 family)